jgi:hypothetical protein
MSFNDRMYTVQKELYSGTRSDLAKETDHTIQEWKQVISDLFTLMWPPPEGFGDNRPAVVQDYVYASAILEWAAINWGDLFGDKVGHDQEGPHFDEPAGRGASIGPFQGYAAEGEKALRSNDALLSKLKSLSKAAAAANLDPPPIPKSKVGNAHDGVRGGGRVPGPQGTDPPVVNSRLRDFLSNYDNLKDPYVSLIGKMQLSVDYAAVTRNFRAYSSETETSHAWRLPDAVLRYVLLVHEVTGGDEDWLRKVAKTIFEADQAADFGKSADHKKDILSFTFKDKRIHYTYVALQVPVSDQCRYEELVNIYE